MAAMNLRGNWMVRRALGMALLLFCAHAAHATKPVTIDEFEAQLNRLHGKADDFVVSRISSFQLTQRATLARLTRWLSDFHGRQARMVLIAIADSSAFLELPQSDSPSTAAPPAEEQRAIITRAITSLEATTHHLPDLSATRNTLEFNDSKEDTGLITFSPTDAPVSKPETERKTHFIDKTSVSVSYVHGSEIFNDRDPARQKRAGRGLTTWGEFGPILSVVFTDIGSEGLSWKGWERNGVGTLAVFRYAVPQGRGHYLVSVRPRVPQQYPAYRGEIAIDPQTGEVARITMLANLEAGPSMAVANIAVEYGPVLIGDKTYNCPVHGVATSQDINVDSAGKALAQLNDIAFTGYHLFRGDVRILPDSPPGT